MEKPKLVGSYVDAVYWLVNMAYSISSILMGIESEISMFWE